MTLLRKSILSTPELKISSTEALFFTYDNKLIDQNLVVRDFLASKFKNEHNDGWLHLVVATQETFGLQ